MAQPEAAGAAPATRRPARVLVVGTDARFLRVASALLAGEGYVVRTAERPSDLLELVHSLRTDVVVIDASRSLAHAARAAASLAALPLPVAAVLVAEPDHIPSLGPPVAAKWGTFDELRGHVDRAVRAMLSHGLYSRSRPSETAPAHIPGASGRGP